MSTDIPLIHSRRLSERHTLSGFTMDWIPHRGDKLLHRKAETVQVVNVSSTGIAVLRQGARHDEKIGSLVVLGKNGHTGVMSVKRVETDRSAKITEYGLEFYRLSETLLSGLVRLAHEEHVRYTWQNSPGS